MWRREDKFILVGTREDFKAIDQASDHIGTRVYRPNYITAKDLEQLITPLLTESIGKVKAAAPSKVGIAADGASAGGDDYAGAEAVMVQDYEKVLTMIDGLVAKMDSRPAQVAIEAMILSVKLDDEHRFGVDFEFLRNNNHVRLATGSPLNTLGEITFEDGGLKFGYLDTNLAMFLDAVETIGDANIIATPRVLCLNRQRAEILIGAQLGYVNTTQTETASTQSVDFLEVGTQLRIRPFIASDGMVRMEVHPELSTGVVRVEQNFTLPDKDVTQVTSNIMVRDGSTVVIGGLIRDEMTTTGNQVPLFGSLPLVGPAFRRTTQSMERREIIVLITPHIVYEPEVGIQGDKAAREFHHRHMVYADQLSPIGKRHLGRRYFHKAQEAWHRGDQERALWLVNLSIHFDPLNRAAIDLRSDITSNNPNGDHTELHPARLAPNLHPLDGEMLAPWLVDELGRPPLPLEHPLDPGTSGPVQPLTPPRSTP
jgi:type IV pilus assembly protein PilQ